MRDGDWNLAETMEKIAGHIARSRHYAVFASSAGLDCV